MRYAISIPQFVEDGSFDPAALRIYLSEAEGFGFRERWTQEQVSARCQTSAAGDDDLRGGLHRTAAAGLAWSS